MQNSDILSLAHLRTDGRRYDELRTIKHKLSLFNGSDGSAYLEQGLNKVTAVVIGPKEPRRRGGGNVTDGQSPSEKHDRRVMELESAINKIASEIVLVDIYPRSELQIVIHVLESDGSVLCAMVNVMSLALMDAGVSMVDIVTACGIACINNRFYVDPTQGEQNYGGAYIPMVVKARSKEVVYLQLDSRLSTEHLEVAISKGIEGCRQLMDYMEAAVKTDLS